MHSDPIQFFSGIILVSAEPAQLAAFYRETLGIPLIAEEHGDTQPHWGCDLGDIHFAVHPVEDFPDKRAGVGSVKLAFNVFDMDVQVAHLASQGVELLYPPRDTGFFLSTAFLDPDGNLVELTQLVPAWFEHLKQRRQGGHDVVARFEDRAQG